MIGTTPACALPSGPLVAFYGDDFTGSSAAMEVLAFAGLRTILFLGPPSAQRLKDFQDYRAIGIAGVARARAPAWMQENLPGIFELLADTGAPVVHYKVCSTFDSAPQIGSIGCAADIGHQRFPGWIPLVVSDPGMGRFQAFGHLFAHYHGVGYRLDRHPVMSVHPVTPMHEADLGRHLARQTALPIGLVDFVSLQRGQAEGLLAREIERGAAIVSIDVLDAQTLQEAGRLVWESPDVSQFVIGSQGVEQALVAHWRAHGLVAAAQTPPTPSPVARIAVVSGSVSLITASQIAHAKAVGFALIPFDASKAIVPDDLQHEVDRAITQALLALGAGRNPLIFTAAGPDDPNVAALRVAVSASGLPISEINDRIGAALGDVLNALVRQAGLKRAVISGGDTSSLAATRLGIDALTAIAPMAPGAPLCRAHSPDHAIDGLELVLKGGQTGAPDFFTAVCAIR
ncbi:MAG: four-carbon acid sugar kinase family protein [Burkholderiaceae bacterium]